MHSDSGRFGLLPDPSNGIQGLLNAPVDQEQGISLDSLREGAVLEVETRHHVYRIKNLGDGKALVSGHPEYCPEPIQVDLIGSDYGGNFPRLGFIGKDARLEFWHPVRGMVRTSRVLDVRERTPLI